MASQGAYSALEHGGLELSKDYSDLEVSKPQSAPEVVPQHDAPEVTSKLHSPLERRSSLSYPEPLLGFQEAPIWNDRSGPKERSSVCDEEFTRDKKARRCCGMRRSAFAIVVIVAVLVVVGAIVGGVLGATRGNDGSGDATEVPENSQHSSDGTGSATDSAENENRTDPLTVQDMSGFATTWLEGRDETLLAYYQDMTGRVLENRFADGKWQLDASNVNDSVVVGPGLAAYGSPLSAISYRWDGQIRRQIFFQDSADRLMTSNITGAASFANWSEPHNILDKRVRPDNIALAACVEPDHMSAMSLFYGSDNGSIWQVYWALNGTGIWSEGARLRGSEDRSGVACHLNGEGEDASLEVFYSNVDNRKIARTTWTEVDQGEERDGTYISSLETVGIGSALTFTTSKMDSGYLFYQNEHGSIRRGFIDGEGSMLQDARSLRNAANGTKLVAALVDDATVYFAQNSSQGGEGFVFSVGADGDEQAFEEMF